MSRDVIPSSPLLAEGFRGEDKINLSNSLLYGDDMAQKNKSMIWSYSLVFMIGFIMSFIVVGSTPDLQPITTPGTQSAKSHIVAVLDNDAGGAFGNVKVDIQPGRGRVLLDTNQFIEPDTQSSAETAVRVAERITGKSLANKDVIFSFDIGNGDIIGGPSAGGAMTIATIAAIEGKSVKDNVVLTGTIDENGNIGPVGGLLGKSQAAGENKISLFLIPNGERLVESNERKEEVVNGLLVVSIVPKSIDLSEYTQKWGVQIEEVGNIDDAVELMIE